MLPVNIDQVLQGLERNIDHLDKENFNKLLKLFLEQIQILQDQTLSIADQKNISIASGIWLDWIGKIVGERREARSDTQYREALRLRIAINSADSTSDTIINITKIATGSDSSKIIDYHPAAFVNSISTSQYTNLMRYGHLVDSIKAAGVKPILVNNIDGNRFTPAWRIDQGLVDGEYTLGVTVGGVLEPLVVNGDYITLYAQVSADDIILNTENAYLQYKGEPSNKGYLAQRIFKDTTAIFSSLTAESFAEDYFAAATSLEVSLVVYPE